MAASIEAAAPATAAAGTSRLYGRLWRWHFFAAAIVIPFVLWQSVTGTLYLWSYKWMDAAHPELRFVRTGARALPVSDQVRTALAAATPAAEVGTVASEPATGAPHHAQHASHSAEVGVERILLSDDPTRSTTVLLQAPNGLSHPLFVDPYTGAVLGELTAGQWLPGITRALHGGWPLGDAGSWLLELGDGWAIVMIATGLYLWWPRGRGFAAGLVPRLRSGTRVLLRDLHSCVAVWFSIVFLFFLISALPWTSLWGNQILAAIEAATGQESPAGFSPGGASVSQFANALGPVDEAVAAARARGVRGTLDVRLAPWPDAPLYIANEHVMPSQDRILLGDASTGAIHGDFVNADLPAIPRFVALGIHVHQGDFGLWNVWLNTAFATSLVWLTVTGLLSWWKRRPKQQLGAPPRVTARAPRFLLPTSIVVCILFPLVGLSVLLVLLADLTAGRWLRPQTQG